VIGGAILISIGILGEYVGKLYEQTKNRPLYLVSRTFNVATSEPGAVAPPKVQETHP
jgi:dolichol-phosphate mannosyltransferase